MTQPVSLTPKSDCCQGSIYKSHPIPSPSRSLVSPPSALRPVCLFFSFHPFKEPSFPFSFLPPLLYPPCTNCVSARLSVFHPHQFSPLPFIFFTLLLSCLCHITAGGTDDRQREIWERMFELFMIQFGCNVLKHTHTHIGDYCYLRTVLMSVFDVFPFGAA